MHLDFNFRCQAQTSPRSLHCTYPGTSRLPQPVQRGQRGWGASPSGSQGRAIQLCVGNIYYSSLVKAEKGKKKCVSNK